MVRAVRLESDATIITDASTKGMGAVLLVGGLPAEYFSFPIPAEFILRFKATTGDPKHMALWKACVYWWRQERGSFDIPLAP